MTAPFTPAQEARIGEIVREIVGKVLQGSDARIRDAICSCQITRVQAFEMGRQTRAAVDTVLNSRAVE